MLIWPTKHVTSLILSYKETVTANGIVAIERMHWWTVNVYSFFSVGPTYRANGQSSCLSYNIYFKSFALVK